jgi:8-hydroxy-5-deazaflavin:NADPH oxidoreductase
MKIGIIGCGNIGRILARLWVEAGHEVILSSRNPDKLLPFAKELIPHATTGTPEDAARLGEVVLLSIPLGEIPKLSKQVRNFLRGKIVLDTCNPYPDRDGQHGAEALNGPNGSGVWVAKQFPGAKMVKAFNTVYYEMLDSESHRKGEPIGVPLASDDKLALQTAIQLVEDAGFSPLVIGDLKTAKLFDNGTRPYASGATVSELQKMLGLKRKAA